MVCLDKTKKVVAILAGIATIIGTIIGTFVAVKPELFEQATTTTAATTTNFKVFPPTRFQRYLQLWLINCINAYCLFWPKFDNLCLVSLTALFFVIFWWISVQKAVKFRWKHSNCGFWYYAVSLAINPNNNCVLLSFCFVRPIRGKIPLEVWYKSTGIVRLVASFFRARIWPHTLRVYSSILYPL